MSSPATYKKWYANELSWDFVRVAELREERLPVPGDDEIVVRNLYAGVNASDVNASKGSHGLYTEPPVPLGIESLGEVTGVGKDVEKYSPGDFVITMERGGGYGEYVVLPARRALSVPAASPEILSVVVSGLSASIGLKVSGEMKSGQTVLITAAAGAVGQFAVQLARQAGNTVIGTCSSEEKKQHLLQLGCDDVINYKTESLDAELKRRYPNGVDLVLESVGQKVFDICVDNLANRGMLVVLGYTTEYKRDEIQKVAAERIYTKLLFKSATVRGFLFSDYIEHFKQHTRDLLEAVASGALKANIDPVEFKGIESVTDAVAWVQAGKNCGKVIVEF